MNESMTSKEHLASLQLLIGERRVDSSSQDVHRTSGDRRDDRPRTFGFSDCLALVNQVDPEQYTAAEDVPELRDEDGPDPLARNPTQVVVESPHHARSEYQ